MEPLTTVAALRTLGQYPQRQPRTKNLAQPAERDLAQSFSLRAQLIKLRTALTAKESVGNSGWKPARVKPAPA